MVEPNHIVAGCTKKYWTEWVPYSEWPEERKKKKWYPYKEPNYRNRYPNECILEPDLPTKQKDLEVTSHAAKKLKQQGIPWELWDTGGKGHHLHIRFDKNLTKPMIKAWVYSVFDKPLADMFDDASWGEKSLIGRENTPHRKTGKIKTLLDSFETKKLNVFPKEIIEKTKKQFMYKTSHREVKFKGKCGVCDLALTQCFPEGTNRHQALIPNLVAYLPKEKWAQAAATQNKNISEFEGWSSKGVEFNCIQLQNYAKKKNLDHICKNCIWRKTKLSTKQKQNVNLIRFARCL